MKGININKLGKIEKNQKIKEGDCIFPFKHLWKEHNECVDTDKGKICATSVTERGTLKTYGYCKEASGQIRPVSGPKEASVKSKSKSPVGLKKGKKKVPKLK